MTTDLDELVLSYKLYARLRTKKKKKNIQFYVHPVDNIGFFFFFKSFGIEINKTNGLLPDTRVKQDGNRNKKLVFFHG